MGLGKVVILIGSFGNISKGYPPERELNSAPAPQSVRRQSRVLRLPKQMCQMLRACRPHRHITSLASQHRLREALPPSPLTRSSRCLEHAPPRTTGQQADDSFPIRPLPSYTGTHSWESAVSNFWEEDTAFFRDRRSYYTHINFKNLPPQKP